MRIFLSILFFLSTIISAAKSDSTKVDAQDEINYYAPTRLSEIGNDVNIDPLRTRIDYKNLAIVGGVTAIGVTAVQLHFANTWWKDQRTEFQFVNDWDYALNVDKIGHFYGTYILAHAFSAGLEAANFQSDEAAIYGAAAALGFQLFVEINDAFGPKWGFSPGDAGADVIGALYSVGLYYIPYLKNFQPRFSYYPSEDYLNGVKKDGNVSDDYEGQKFWLSLRMKELLPEPAAKFWPSFLMLSGGIGVSNLDGSGGGTKEFYISFDLDAEKLPLHGRVWQFVKNTLNYFHLPMPGIRISPDAAFFVFLY